MYPIPGSNGDVSSYDWDMTFHKNERQCPLCRWVQCSPVKNRNRPENEFRNINVEQVSAHFTVIPSSCLTQIFSTLMIFRKQAILETHAFHPSQR
jgi:hypothetical protein